MIAEWAQSGWIAAGGAGTIIIGLGTGRCGTASLAHLISSQPNALCFHELNAVCTRFFDTPRPLENTVEEFAAILDGGPPARLTADLSRKSIARDYQRLCGMSQPRALGDVGFYYLSYVRRLAALDRRIRFVCLQRDREATVESWLRQALVSKTWREQLADRLRSLVMNEPYRPLRNFWMDHDGTRWMPDPVWDKTMPKFQARSPREAADEYWRYYYAQAEALQADLPGVFRIFNISALSVFEEQRELLAFCGFAPEEQRTARVHHNFAGQDQARSSAASTPATAIQAPGVSA